jgi:hydroxymethylpyrimidine pyrophosphatase-like HAD family hydrolase
MEYLFRAVALDYDGTIADGGRVNPQVLKAAAELRRRGRRVVLCTGRIMAELQEVFPGAEQHFDAIVAENGAVLCMPGRADRPLAVPLPRALATALQERGVPARSGTVLTATEAVHSHRVLEEVERLGLDAQLVRNRGELMVLPSGVSKASGLLEALAELEVSRHSAIAFGDAENDLAMLHACEIGVGVANSVDVVRERADVLLEQADGAGVAEFLMGPVLSGDIHVRPQRWRVTVGATQEGNPVTLPGSRINVLVAGVSCAGKSYLAGALMERLVEAGYSACVFDCEGDHVDLGRLPGVVTAGGAEPLPTPAQLGRLLRNRFSSVVVDLSLLDAAAKRAYFTSAMAEVMTLRRSSGLPHWIVVEEADQLLDGDPLPAEEPHLPPVGYCLVTHRPGALSRTALEAVHAVVAVAGGERYATSGGAGAGNRRVDTPFALGPGEALLALDGRTTIFRVPDRVAAHVRHRHKYLHAQVPPQRRFFFATGASSEAAAGNLAEFCQMVRRLEGPVLEGHLSAGDFSRWVREVLADDMLGARLRSVERWYRNDAGELDIEHVREAVIAEVEGRYQLEFNGA